MREMKENLIPVKVEGKQLIHMAFDTAHLSKYEYTIISDNKFVDGRKFYSESKTRKRRGTYGSFGKTEVVWYFDMDTEIFKTGRELLESIGLTELTLPQH